MLQHLCCFANRAVGSSPLSSATTGGWPQVNTSWAGPTESAYGEGRPPEEPLELDATGIGAVPAAMTVLLEFFERGSAVHTTEPAPDST